MRCVKFMYCSLESPLRLREVTWVVRGGHGKEAVQKRQLHRACFSLGAAGEV